MDRLKAAEKEAHDAMEEDVESLAKAKLKHKEVSGVDGVDALSRTEEQIADLERRMKRSASS